MDLNAAVKSAVEPLQVQIAYLTQQIKDRDAKIVQMQNRIAELEQFSPEVEAAKKQQAIAEARQQKEDAERKLKELGEGVVEDIL